MKLTHVFLLTDAADADIAAQGLAGGRGLLHFKAEYVPPYEELKLIRRFQLAERRLFPMGESACAVIDVTEWIGREREEYFDVFAKFLHDDRRHRYIFTAAGHDGAECMGLFMKLRCLFAIRMERGAANELSGLTQTLISEGAEPDGAELLAELLCSGPLPCGVNRAEAARQALREIVSLRSGTSAQAVIEYAQDSGSVICMLLGRAAVEQLSCRKEYRDAV